MYIFEPLKTFQSDLKLIHFYYSKILIKYFHKFEIAKSKYLSKLQWSIIFIKIILKYNPKQCVEVGGGYSTLIILKALEKNYKKDGIKPSLLSLEQDENYLEIHKKYLKENLNKTAYNFLAWEKTNLEVTEFLNTKISKCKNLDEQNIDFFMKIGQITKNIKLQEMQ